MSLEVLSHALIKSGVASMFHFHLTFFIDSSSLRAASEFLFGWCGVGYDKSQIYEGEFLTKKGQEFEKFHKSQKFDKEIRTWDNLIFFLIWVDKRILKA